jgi:hypothetical protein
MSDQPPTRLPKEIHQALEAAKDHPAARVAHLIGSLETGLPGRLAENHESAAEPPLGEGDDDALILWFLSLTPAQRLATAQGFVDSVRLLKNGLRS